MKLKKLATSTITSILLFGSVGQLAIGAKPVSANHPIDSLELARTSKTSKSLLVPANFDRAENAIADKAELVNINFKRRFRHRGRRRFRRYGRRNFRRFGRRGFRRYGRRNFRRFGRYNNRRHLKFDNAFSTGNSIDEKIIRVRLF
ncbi:MAG: hypothetical protein AAF915_09135 [Cyanobacteria bacterium P01_D01_bin.50]